MVTHFFLLLLSNQHKNIYNKINLQEIERGMKALEFGEKLRAAREKKRITQQTLADYLFVTRQTVSRWECGTRFPDLLTAKKISGILEVSLDELLSEEDSAKKNGYIALLVLAKNVLESCIDVLGFEAPERM